MKALPNLDQLGHAKKHGLLLALFKQVGLLNAKVAELEGHFFQSSQNSNRSPSSLTWVGSHPNRGKKAFDAFGILNRFQGTLVHNGWKPYRDLNCTHALCNAHHLRELTYLFEELEQPWAKRLIDLLVDANREVAKTAGALAAERMARYGVRYHEILIAGALVNPRVSSAARRGKAKQSKGRNLIDRLRDRAEDVWRFMTHPRVPFSNDLAEQTVRMPKVKQTISGGFRTPSGLETFCTIRSYLATLQKQGNNLFQALTQTFQDQTPSPHFV